MIDLVALVATLGKTAATVSSVTKIVSEALGRRRELRKEQVRDLADQLKDLSEQLDSLSEMGRALDRYTNFLIETLEAYRVCENLRDFVSYNERELANRRYRTYDARWAHVEELVKKVDKSLEDHATINLDRVKFLDTADATAIKSYIEQFNSHYYAIKADMSSRSPDPLKRRVDEMRRILLKIGKVFEDSIFNKMIRSLTEIRRV